MDKNSIITAGAHDYQAGRAGILKLLGNWLTDIDPDLVLSTTFKTALIVTAAGAAANLLGTAYMDEAAKSMGLQNWLASLPEGVGYLWKTSPLVPVYNAADMNLSAGLEHLRELPAYGVSKVLGAYAFIGALPTIVATAGVARIVGALRYLGTAPNAQDAPTISRSPSTA